MTEKINTQLRRESVVRETPKAICVRVDQSTTGFHPREYWLPKSQIEWRADHPYTEAFYAPAWLIRKTFTPY